MFFPSRINRNPRKLTVSDCVVLAMVNLQRLTNKELLNNVTLSLLGN